jgi:hypothetical protein
VRYIVVINKQMENLLFQLWSLLFLFFLISCVDQQGNDLTNQAQTLIKSSIIDGEFDSENSLKNVAFIHSKNSICTSTIIHPYIVLTAAHCVDDIVRGIILSNSVDMTSSQSTIIIPVQKIITNPGYKIFSEERIKEAQLLRESMIANGEEFSEDLKINLRGQEGEDIALIILKEKAPIANSSIVPLISEKEIEEFNIQVGDDVTIVGYGKNEIGNVSGARNYKKIKIKNEKICNDYQSGNIWNLGIGAWSGDSGGPAFILKKNKIRQIGIASTVSGNINENTSNFLCKRSYYTNVAAHLTWIKEQVGYYPGVNFSELSSNLQKKYDLHLPLSNKETKSYELSNIEDARYKITPRFLKIKYSQVDELDEIKVNIILYNCKENDIDCKEIEHIGSATLKNNTSYKFDNFSSVIKLSDLEFKKGTMKFQIEVEKGYFEESVIIGTQIFPTSPTVNFTQEQVNSKINLIRSTSIYNESIEMPLEFQLIL